MNNTLEKWSGEKTVFFQVFMLFPSRVVTVIISSFSPVPMPTATQIPGKQYAICSHDQTSFKYALTFKSSLCDLNFRYTFCNILMTIQSK